MDMELDKLLGAISLIIKNTVHMDCLSLAIPLEDLTNALQKAAKLASI